MPKQPITTLGNSIIGSGPGFRRFDRAGSAGRTMFVSAATLLGADAGEPGQPSYTEIVDTLRVHGADAQTDILVPAVHALVRDYGNQRADVGEPSLYADDEGDE